MVDAVETPQENQEQGKPDYSAIIRRRTGKDNLSLTSLRGIAVAELHEVGEELGLDHVNLKKADLIHSLLRTVGQVRMCCTRRKPVQHWTDALLDD